VINRDDIYTNNLIVGGGGTWFVHLINNVALYEGCAMLDLFIAFSSGGMTNGISIETTVANRLYINKRIAGSQTQINILQLTTT
jgi:hypothetical protein